jgi:opacity protein-like surface antigen
MRHGSIRSLRLAAALVTLASSSAWAADAGFYFGVNVGRSEFDSDSGPVSQPAPVLLSVGGAPGTFFNPLPAGNIFLARPGGTFAILAAPVSSSDLDESDTAFSAAVGYTFNRYLSVELSYADLGELTSSSVTSFGSIDPTLMPTSFRVTQKLAAETIAISVLGTLPLSERWSLFARGGYGFSESDLKVRAAFSIPGSTATQFEQDFDSEDFVVGAGVGFRLSTRWSLRADYERVFEAGAEALDVDRIGLSAILRL